MSRECETWSPNMSLPENEKGSDRQENARDSI
jgi:hypothetical protein